MNISSRITDVDLILLGMQGFNLTSKIVINLCIKMQLNESDRMHKINKTIKIK